MVGGVVVVEAEDVVVVVVVVGDVEFNVGISTVTEQVLLSASQSRAFIK